MAPKISLAFAGPQDVPLPLMFERPLLSSAFLTRARRLSSAPVSTWPSGTGPAGWRFGALPAYFRRLPSCWKWWRRACWSSSTAAARSPGKFVNLAVLEGDDVKVIDSHAATVPDCPALLSSLLGLESLLEPAEPAAC